MSWWRKLVRWLAREDLAAAELSRQEFARFAFNAGVQADIAERLAFARGELSGSAKAFEAVELAVAQRMAGGDDLVSKDDLIEAKRRLLH